MKKVSKETKKSVFLEKKVLTYKDDDTGITAVVDGGLFTLFTSNNRLEFVFKDSQRETVKKVGETLVRLSGVKY